MWRRHVHGFTQLAGAHLVSSLQPGCAGDELHVDGPQHSIHYTVEPKLDHFPKIPLKPLILKNQRCLWGGIHTLAFGHNVNVRLIYPKNPMHAGAETPLQLNGTVQARQLLRLGILYPELLGPLLQAWLCLLHVRQHRGWADAPAAPEGLQGWDVVQAVPDGGGVHMHALSHVASPEQPGSTLGFLGRDGEGAPVLDVQQGATLLQRAPPAVDELGGVARSVRGMPLLQQGDSQPNGLCGTREGGVPLTAQLPLANGHGPHGVELFGQLGALRREIGHGLHANRYTTR